MTIQLPIRPRRLRRLLVLMWFGATVVAVSPICAVPAGVWW